MPQLVGEAKAKWRPSYAPQSGRTAYVSQERSPIEGRISVGILEPRDRPVSVLLQVPFLIQYPVGLALPTLTLMQTSRRSLYRY